MKTLWEKLNIKSAALVIIAIPDSMQLPVHELPTDVHWSAAVADLPASGAALIFVTDEGDISHWAQELNNHALSDPVIWFAYPKKTKAHPNPAINRDSGWQSLTNRGWRPVRQVAIDEQWSALRFRRGEYVKSS